MPPKPRKPPPPRSGGRNRNLLIAAGAAAIVVIGLVAASLLLRGGDSGSEASTTDGAGQVSTLLDGIPQDRTLLGSSDAKVTMIQFEDLQCPICGRYQQEVFPGVIDEYVKPGKVKLRFVGLAFIGPDSEKALLHVLAAGEQGKLWQFADAALRQPGRRELGLGDRRPPEADLRRPRAGLREAHVGRERPRRAPAGELDGRRGPAAQDPGHALVLPSRWVTPSRTRYSRSRSRSRSSERSSTTRSPAEAVP